MHISIYICNCCTFCGLLPEKVSGLSSSRIVSVWCTRLCRSLQELFCHLLAFKFISKFAKSYVFDRCFVNTFYEYFLPGYIGLKHFICCRGFLLLSLFVYYFCIFQCLVLPTNILRYRLLLFKNHAEMNLVKTGTATASDF